MQPFSNTASLHEETENTVNVSESLSRQSTRSVDIEASPRASSDLPPTLHPVTETREKDGRIAERIANQYKLRLMKHSPEAKQRLEHPTTIIAPEGVFQWNAEIEQWTCRLSVENFNAAYPILSFLVQRANEVNDPEGESAYNALTLKQLNALDQAIQLHHGDTIIGYSICEEIYLRQINFFVWLFCRRCSEYDYPPLPEAYSKRLLTFIQRPLVLDIASSLRVAAQSYLLFAYFLTTYSQYAPQSQDDYLYFVDKNSS